jgi:6-phosphogluconolactonase (cycloisomerase 2 family)
MLVRIGSLGLILATAALIISCGNNGGGSKGTHLAYVTLPSTNQVVGLTIDEGSGSLSTISGSPFTTGNSPSSVVIHPSKKFAYVSNSAENTISLFTIDGSGRLTEVPPRTSTGIAPASMTMDSAGSFLFVGTRLEVSVYTIDAGSGALNEIPSSPFPVAGPVGLTVSPSGKYLYMASSTGSSVVQYTINPDGSLANFASFAAGANPSSIAIDPAGHFLYTTNLVSTTFRGFAIDSNTGALTGIPQSPFTAGTNPSAVAVDGSGKFLYVANFGSNNINAFTIDATNGFPTAITGTNSTGTAPVFLSLDSGSGYLFAGNQSAHNISGFTIDSGAGTLAATKQSTFTVGTSPSSMSISK